MELPQARKTLLREGLSELSRSVIAEAKAMFKRQEEAGRTAALGAASATPAPADGLPKCVVADLPGIEGNAAQCAPSSPPSPR